MKKLFVVIILFLTVTKISASPHWDAVRKEFGEEYYALRRQLIYEYDQFYNIEELYSISDEQKKKQLKEKYINILQKLLTDKNITKTGKSLSEHINNNPSKFMIFEGGLITNEIIELILLDTGYSGGLISSEHARDDNYKKLNPKHKKVFIDALEMRYKIKKIELHLNNIKMPEVCLDPYVRNLMYKVNSHSRKLNKEAIDTAKGLLDKGCIYIGILHNYARALGNEMKFSDKNADAYLAYIEVYDQYFDKLIDNDPNLTRDFLSRVAWTKLSHGDRNGALKIINQILNDIALDRIQVKEKPQWLRLNILGMFGWIPDNQINLKLKEIVKKKGNIFIHEGEVITDYMNERDKKFIKQVFPEVDLSKTR